MNGGTVLKIVFGGNSIPFAVLAGAAAAALILLVMIVRRISRGNRERKQLLDALNGSVQDIRDTLATMGASQDGSSEDEPEEPQKTVVWIDNRVGPCMRAEDSSLSGNEAFSGSVSRYGNVSLSEDASLSRNSGIKKDPVLSAEYSGLQTGAENQLEEEGAPAEEEADSEPVETVEQILAMAEAEEAEGKMAADGPKIPVPEEPLPASLSASPQQKEAPRMEKYMDRHCGTNKQGETFTAEELRRTIR